MDQQTHDEFEDGNSECNDESISTVGSPRLRKLSRAMMPKWKVRQLKVVQGGLCPLCGKPVDLTVPKEGVVDHDHETGEIRGVLHRSCNSGEGKASNAIGSWIVKSMSQAAIIEGVVRLYNYYMQPGTGMMYPTHKSKEETENIRRNKRNLAAKERRAQLKARKLIKERT